MVEGIQNRALVLFCERLTFISFETFPFPWDFAALVRFFRQISSGRWFSIDPDEWELASPEAVDRCSLFGLNNLDIFLPGNDLLEVPRRGGETLC